MRIFCVVFGLLLVNNSYSATITSKVVVGNWDAGGSWVGGNVPLNTDNVVIAASAIISTNGSRTCAAITINGTLSMANPDLLTVNGNVSGSGTWTTSGSARTISLSGNWTFTGTSASNGASVIFTGTTNQTLSGKITSLGGSLTINKTSGSVTLGSAISIGSFILTSGTFDASTYLLSAASVTYTTGTLRVGAANWASNYSFAVTEPSTGTIEYYAATAQVVNGISYAGNLLLSGGGAKSVSGNITVNGVLTLTNGTLAIGNYDLTLLNPVSGTFDNTHMIITSGTGSLIKKGTINSDFVMVYPIGTGTSYTPMQINSFSPTGITAPGLIKVRTVASAIAGVPGVNPLNRYWITSSSNITTSVVADVRFGYVAADVNAAAIASDYDIFYLPNASVWSTPGGSSLTGANPLAASTTTSVDATWSASVSNKRIFYSMMTGDWDNPQTWTLDPSGAQYNNPGGLTPSTSPTSSFDEVVILSGRTISILSGNNNKANAKITVNGRLDFTTTIGHTFTYINGTGIIRLAGDNFPAGDASDFISKGQGEGTVEYYGLTRNLNTARTFCHVIVNLDAVGNILTLLRDHTIAGNLTIQNGIFQINDNSAITGINIKVNGDVLIGSSGKLYTGKGNARHQFNMFGNITNNGELKFTNRTVANYTAEATDGIVDANFLNTSQNQNILCNGLTNFYRIEVDKGTDATYTLNIDATAAANFNLWGFANEDHGAVAQLATNNNALGLLRGTVRLGNNINIPLLSMASNYNISEAAQLLVDGGFIAKNSGNAIVPYGKIMVNSGTIEARIPSGITLRNNGTLYVNGGTVNINQLRTSELGAANIGGYVQTDGIVNVLGGNTSTDFYVFCLTYTNSVFNMSGGELHVNTSNGLGSIFINSDPANIKVTGGTVFCETASTQNFVITSRAPFWNLIFKNSTAIARDFILDAGVNVGPTDINLPAQPLVVLNDFRIWGKESGGAAYPAINFKPVTSATNVNDVYVGGSLFLENGTQYTTVFGNTSPYNTLATQPTTANTTHFNQTVATAGIAYLYWGNTTNELELGNFELNRTHGYELQLTSAAARVSESVAMDVNGSASVLSGTLNQGLFTIRTWGSITNKDRMGTWYPATTPSKAQIQFADNPLLTISTTANAIFGNIQMNVSPPTKITLTSDVYIERMEYLKGLIYLKGYNLKIDDMWDMETGLFENSTVSSFLKVPNAGYTANSLIYTDGKAGDGGLSLKIRANSQVENQPNMLNNVGPLTFPLGFTDGTNLYFRPAQMVVKNFSDDGYVTVRPVMGFLQTSNNAGGEILQHYWRVTQAGFTAVPTVAYRFYYRNQSTVANLDLPSGTVSEVNYVPGKVLDMNPYSRSYELLTENDILKNIGTTFTRAITFNGSTSSNGLFTPSVVGFPLENSNYTAGLVPRFTGSVLIYYTRDADPNNFSGNSWTDPNNWTRSDILNTTLSPHDSRQPAAPALSYPKAGDVAVIGWVPWTDTNRPTKLGQPHCADITVGTNAVAAEVVFTKMTDASGNPVPRYYRYNFSFRPTMIIDAQGGTPASLTAKLVKGEGMIWNRASAPDFSLFDIGDFAREDSSYVLYENFTSPSRTISNTPALFPNLFLSNDNWGSNNHDLTFTKDITTTGNLELLGDVNVLLSSGATGNYTIGRNLIFFESSMGGVSGGGAELAFQNSGTPRVFTVNKDILFRNIGAVVDVRTPNGGITLDHQLHVGGNISQNAGTGAPVGLKLGLTGDLARVNLYLDGNTSMIYNLTSGSIPELYRLIVNKGNSISTTAQFNCDFNLNGPTLGAGVSKALELKNGLFIINNAAVTMNLTTGNDNFSIPSTAGLEMRQGIAYANGNSGIVLDGLLKLSGGSLDMSGGGSNSFIEYSASGNANLSISSGTLTVGGQIRRSLTSNVGVISYNQSGGTVIVGQNAAPTGNRGLFEILNAGSSFNMTGGDLYIVRQQTSPTIAAFYLDPSSSNISNSAFIHIGNAATPVGQTIGIYTTASLPNLRIDNTSGNNPIAQLQIVSSTISSLLQIDAGATFDANGLDLNIQGNFTNNGTFTAKGNTTYFNGTGITQMILGNTSFYNVNKSTASNLILTAGNAALTVNNNLILQAGTLTDNSNTIRVKGDCQNDAIHIFGAGTGDGVLLNGTQSQVLTGNGSFGKLTINNNNGISIPVGNQLKINSSLKMQNGILNIGRNLLDLGLNAIIEQASPFSKSNMIQTNISFSDYGVRKIFPAGASATPFIFPIGSTGKYTPVTFTISANGNSTGSITVKPANEYQPSVLDPNNVLQYYWTLKCSGITGFSATADMNFIASDVKVTGPKTINDFESARLLNDGSGNWNKPYGNIFPLLSKLTFSFSGASDATLNADYTAGLDIALPNTVPFYETTTSGNWTNDPIWNPSVAGGPRGAIARINTGHTVDVSQNYLSGYSTEVYGSLKLYATYGHRLGIVNGTGLIYTEQGDLPAGNYDNFFSALGGTVEFGGSGSYDALGNVIDINHLKFSGTGDKRLPNNDLHLYGNLTINGGAGLNVININNKKITIEGTLTRTSGNFISGTGSTASVVFSGTLPQQILGAFTGSNAFNILEVKNNGLNLGSDIEINNRLILTKGLVNTNGNILRVKYNADAFPVNGTPTSFVNGTLTKELMNSNNFTFPIGENNGNLGAVKISNITGTTGIQDWKATYHYSDPTTTGYNANNFSAPISQVSKTEFWNLQGPTGGSAMITINMDGSNDVASAVSNIANLRVVGWNTSTSKWDIVGSGVNTTGTAISGSVSTTSVVNFNNYSYFTLASISPIISGTATITNSDFNLCNGSNADIVVALTGVTPSWIITYTAGSTLYTSPLISSSPYKINVSPSSTTTYTLVSVTAGGVPGSLVGNIDTKVTVNPAPTVLLNASCPGGSGNTLTYTASSGLTNYNYRVNGSTVQNGASNSYVTSTLGDGQSVDVIATNAANCSTTSSALINQLPYSAGAITGSMSVCANASGVTYTVPAITNSLATGYIWTLPALATVTAGAGTNSITINFNTTAAGNYNIYVKGSNGCGAGKVSTAFPVSVSTAVTPGPASSITGTTPVCRAASATYTVPVIANATSYVWMYSGTGATNHADGTVINATGQSTVGNSITIDFSTIASATGNLTVKGIGCGSGATSASFAIATNAVPTATANSNSPVCEGQSLNLLGSGTGTGTLSYSWSGPGSYVSSTQNPAIASATVSSTGIFTLTVKDGNNCSATATTDVTINAKPLATAGPDIIACSGSAPITLTGAAASGSYSGTPVWTGSGGSFVVNPDPALATFTPTAVSGSITATLTLTGISGCSNAATTRLITWNILPAITSQPSSPGAVCATTGTPGFTIAASGANLTYLWQEFISSWINVVDNSRYAGSQTATLVITSPPASMNGNKYRCVITNSCSSVTSNGLAVLTVNVNPTVTISPVSPQTCAGVGFIITTTPAGGSGIYSSYVWTGTGAASLSSINVVNPTFTNSTAASYALSAVVTDDKGCIGIANTTVVVTKLPTTGPVYHKFN